MSVLARYLMRAVLGNTALVMLVLLVLSGLQLFIEQQDDVGVGTFAMEDAVLYMVLMLPRYAFDLLPIGALIGALLALGNLARSMELIVVRTSGVSTLRLSLWVAAAGFVLMLVMWAVGDFVAPPMERYARQMKTFEKYHDYSMTGRLGAWAKDGNTIISVQQQSADNRYGGIYVFEFNEQRRLVSMGRAASASIDSDNRWLLESYRETTIEENGVTTAREPTAVLETRLSPEFLGLASVEPGALPGRALYGFVRHLQDNDLEARAYETAFWSRISRTVAVGIIVVLAVPFAFGPMRSTGTGARTVVGILIGVVFFLLARMLESGGAVFNLSPALVAWLPTILLALVTSVAVSRVR